jgi:TonB family protein
MTGNIRPYFLISLGFHFCLMILLFLMKGPRVTEVVPRRVVIEFSQRSERTLPPVTPGQEGLLELAPQQLAESLKMEGPRTLAMPGTRSVVESPQPRLFQGGERLTFAAKQEPLVPQPNSPAAAPLLPAQFPARELESPPAPLPAEDGGLTKEGGYSQAAALEWRGRERKLLKTAGITFPDILLEEGLEVDVVAVITVAANGQVIQVDILRSSGYATVDTAVKQALRSYLFEPSEDSSEDVGQIQVRFRLERGD